MGCKINFQAKFICKVPTFLSIDLLNDSNIITSKLICFIFLPLFIRKTCLSKPHFYRDSKTGMYKGIHFTHYCFQTDFGAPPTGPKGINELLVPLDKVYTLANRSGLSLPRKPFIHMSLCGLLGWLYLKHFWIS